MPEIPIPERARHRPVRSGLAVPYVTLEIDGKIMFGETRGMRMTECIVEHRCQLCGERLDEKFVLLMTEKQLADRFTAEPPLHPECAAYAQRACPMIAGRMPHYAWIVRNHTGKQCTEPGCGCGGWVTDNPGAKAGRPAEPWFAVWVTDYTIGIKDAAFGLVNGNVNGCALTSEPLKVRRIAPAAGTEA